MVAKSTLRRNIIITLFHAENRQISQQFIFRRLRETFKCNTVIISKEKKQHGGFDFHVGVRCSDASKNTAPKKIRELFKEFEGAQCSVQFKKGWRPIYRLLTKQDKEPFVWEEETTENQLEVSSAFGQNEKITVKGVRPCVTTETKKKRGRPPKEKKEVQGSFSQTIGYFHKRFKQLPVDMFFWLLKFFFFWCINVPIIYFIRGRFPISILPPPPPETVVPQENGLSTFLIFSVSLILIGIFSS